MTRLLERNRSCMGFESYPPLKTYTIFTIQQAIFVIARIDRLQMKVLDIHIQSNLTLQFKIQKFQLQSRQNLQVYIGQKLFLRKEHLQKLFIYMILQI